LREVTNKELYLQNKKDKRGVLDTFYPQLVGKTKYEQLKSIIFRIPWGHQRYLIDKFYNKGLEIPVG